MSDYESEDEFNLTPTEIVQAAKETANALLPEISRERYETAYNVFVQWKEKVKATSFSENVLLAYFSELSKKYAPTTIWSKYSMIRAMIKMKHDIDIKQQYPSLLSFVKQNGKGFRSKKAKVLTSFQIEQFLNIAPNKEYLAVKVIAIFGICGACRTCEFLNLKTVNVEDRGTSYLVTVEASKTDIERSFTIGNKFYHLVQQYRSLRPKKALTNRFFLNYRNQKCTSQVIGKNTFSQTPRKIASFLDLPEPERYTGHCFRRTSTTLLADAGGDILQIKRHGEVGNRTRLLKATLPTPSAIGRKQKS